MLLRVANYSFRGGGFFHRKVKFLFGRLVGAPQPADHIIHLVLGIRIEFKSFEVQSSEHHDESSRNFKNNIQNS